MWKMMAKFFNVKVVVSLEIAGVHPLVGDFVTYVPDGDNDAIITVVHERKNELVRPPISNVDQAITCIFNR